ncbi:MAG: HAMP domain-containing histidine kinase [Chitinophagaceae bacterium]|nr:MAG: HAMP domain-containing histidine kinase [Chitinophagaceae bacterium]
MENPQSWPEIIASHTPTIFFSYSVTESKLLFINDAVSAVFNVTAAAAMEDASLLTRKVMVEEKEATKAFYAKLQGQESAATDIRIQVTEDSIKWIALRASLITTADQEVIVGTITDITSEKDYAATIQKYTEKKNSILQILSHDILNIMNNIKIAATLLDEYESVRHDENIKSLVELITSSADSSVGMIHDLTHAEFVESSDSSIVKERVDLVQHSRNMMDQYRRSPLTGSQLFQFVCASESLFVNIDASKFMQVLNNLISNALKFTPDDGRITLTLSADAEYAIIQVTDNGIGIPEHLQPYLFEKYTRASRKGLRGEPTTGLGMSIIKTIVEWHNGELSFSSEEGKGSSFFVKIPLA